MEDIRTYLDTTDGSYHKGETHSVAIFAGLSYIAVGLFWLVAGIVYLVRYGGSFDEVAGALSLDSISSGQAWALGLFRPVLGAFLVYLGLVAWDMRRGFLYWAWAVTPLYAWFWGGYLLEMDPEFRAQEMALGNLFQYPGGLLMAGSILLLLLVLPLVTLQGWIFRASSKDPMPVFVVGIVGLLGFGAYSFTSEMAPEVRTTPMVYCLEPLDHLNSGLPLLKLIALSHEDLMCHDNMDELRDALERYETSVREITYRNWGNRPKGERLVRLLQQSAGLGDGIVCPEDGYYSIHKETGAWRCSRHGERLPREERAVGDLGESGVEDAGEL